MDEKPKIEMDISNVMFSLVPNAIWSVKNGVLRWNDNSVTQPTEAEIQTEMIRLQTEYDAQEYARNREAEYPSIAKLTVAMYDEDDKAAIDAKRAAVKKKWPKDNSGPVE